jgi:hypothetical protein
VRRRAIIAIVLGALTTIAVAWFLALAPAARRWTGAAASLDVPDVSPARFFDIEYERSRTDEWFQLSVKVFEESTFPSGEKYLGAMPAYATLGPILSIEPPWRFTAAISPAVREALAAFPYPPGSSQRAAGRGYPRWPGWLPPIPDSSKGLLSYGGRATGWPLKSMRSLSHLDSISGELVWSGSLRVRPRSAYKVQAARGPQLGCIPLFPVPVAFAADSLLFGALWSVPLFLPRLIRSRSRRRRGRCPACGYDLSGRAQCPECGAAHHRNPAPAAAK